MKSYVLTDRERSEIRQYLKDKVNTGLISVIKTRAKQNMPRYREDLQLINQLLTS